MKRGYFIVLVVFLILFLVYASPKENLLLDPGSGPCSQYTNAVDCEKNGCEAEYTEKAARNAFGCQSTTSVFLKCNERNCEPIPNSGLSTTPAKNIVHSVPYVGGENLPVSINIKKSGSSYAFYSISNSRYQTESLATGQYCKIFGVNFLDGTEIYSYPLELREQIPIDDKTTRCLYAISAAAMGLLDEKQVYVFDNGVRVSNCPAGTLNPGESCRTSWAGVCTIKAAGKVQMPVLIKEYCGEWTAQTLSPGGNFQAQVTSCDTSLRNAIQGSHTSNCRNTPPGIQAQGKSSPNLVMGEKCELEWIVTDSQDQGGFNTKLIAPKYATSLTGITTGDLSKLYESKPTYTKTMPYVMYGENGRLTFSGSNIIKKIYGIVVDSGRGIDSEGRTCTTDQLSSVASKDISISTTDLKGKKAIQLPRLRFIVTKTTYASSCDPSGALDAGIVIETVIDRWFLPETCQIAGKTDIVIKYRNIMGGEPSDDVIKQGIYEAIEAALDGGLDESGLQRIRDFIFRYYVPPPHKEWQYNPLTSEIIDGKVYVSTQGRQMSDPPSLLPNKQNELLLNPPQVRNFKNIKNAKGVESIRSVRIEVLEGAAGSADKCFNNLKLEDQDPPGFNTEEKQRAMQDAKFAEIDAFYNQHIKGHYDIWKALFENMKSCFCRE